MVSRAKLLQALDRLQERAPGEHLSIIQSSDVSRADRELLLKAGWLREIIRGWYLFVRPDAPTQDSTVWYAHFWEFLAIYLKKLYQNQYCLSAEASLDILLDKPTTPKQVIIITSKGGSGSPRLLPYDTSLLLYNDPKNIPIERILVRNLQVMPLSLAICKVAPLFFKTSPIEAEIALRSIKTASELSQVILKYDLKRSAARLIGAYQFLGLTKMANELKTQLEAFDVNTMAENPFEVTIPLLKSLRPLSPYTGRIEALWAKFRQPIIDVFPTPMTLPQNSIAYFKHIDEIYTQDAYHSLSIEGFQVTQKLIEQVKSNQWNPDLNSGDYEKRNALAARGYYEAFQAVRDTLHIILRDEKNPGEVMETQLQIWFRALFAPCAKAGIIAESELLGYRQHRVHIRNSRHVPPAPEAVIDAMEMFFLCLKNESHAAVRVILGHYIFVFIHPYMDGNGRIGRFLMNAMLASGGYPWIIVPFELREEYMKSLEIAGSQQDIIPFTRLIAKLVATPFI